MGYWNGQINVAATSTEYDVHDAVSADGRWVLVIDLNPMAIGDEIEIYAFVKCRSGSTARRAFTGYYADEQIEPVIYSPPVPISSTEEVQFKIKQNAGSAVGNLDWNLMRM